MESNMRDVLAVVVTYNRKTLLSGCIERLLGQSFPCDILIIDNGSSDGTKESIEGLINDNLIIYKNTGVNLGGAGGFNYGLRAAVEQGYKYVWIMDDDTYPNKDALEKLFYASDALNDNYGFLSSVALWKDGTLCNMNIQRESPYKKIEGMPSENRKVQMATFVSFFLKTQTIKEVGLPIKEFFIWSDDFEYSRRISMKYPCYLISDSIVEHYMKTNQKVGIEAESEDRLWRYEYMYRNEVYVYRREGLKGYLYLFMRFALHNIRIITKAHENKVVKLKVIWKSFIKGFSFKPTIEHV